MADGGDDARSLTILEQGGAELTTPGSSSAYAQEVQRRLKVAVDLPLKKIERVDPALEKVMAATVLAREQERERKTWGGCDWSKARAGYAGDHEQPVTWELGNLRSLAPTKMRG